VGKSFYLNIHVDIYNRINTYHNDEALASFIKQNTQQMEKGKTKKEDPSPNQKNKTKSGPQRGK
jgi:hypothetical protein